MKYMVLRLILACISVICAYKWSDWRNWKKYYPTMLFFGMGDLIYIAVFHHLPLWRFETHILVPSINELFVIFTIFSSSSLLFLSNYPKKLHAKIVYFAFWIYIYMTLEIITLSIGMITYHNDWNIWWSLLYNTFLFPLLILHYKNPIVAWIMAFVFLFIMMKIFHVPFVIE